MKTLFVSFIAMALSAGAFAQDQQKDMITMKDSKVVVIKDGKSWNLAQDSTLANGTIVTITGTVKSTDGNIIMLKEGDIVNADGTVGRKAEPAKKDSTSNE
ncbi:MAG: DUF6799 domain-containing protein [Ginsengibacter sp.]